MSVCRCVCVRACERVASTKSTPKASGASSAYSGGSSA